MPRRKTHEEYIQQLKDKNINIVPIEQYVNNSTPIFHKCLNPECEYEWESSPNVILSIASHCPICYRRRLVKGLKFTRPDLYELLVDKRDGHKYTEYSSKKVLWECPNCHKHVSASVCQVSYNGLYCKFCSDGVSYPMKFTMSVLEQLGIDFETEVCFNWAKFKYHKHIRSARYDIVFDKYIIEVDGNFHFNPHSKSNMTLEDIHYIDSEKDKLAINNGYQMIRIDCRISNKDYIQNSICKSKLGDMYDLTNIDWDKCDLFASSSILKYVCDLWNESNNPSRKYIQEQTGFGKNMVYKYLKKGSKLGICSYNPDVEKRKNWNNREKLIESVATKVVCLNNRKVFDTLTNAGKWCNTMSLTNIVKNCKGEVQFANKHPLTGEDCNGHFMKIT